MEYNTAKEFEEALKAKERFVLLVSADWCGPCRDAKPAVARLTREAKIRTLCIRLEDKGRIDREEISRINAVPTLIAYVDGKPAAFQEGWGGPDEFRAWLTEVFGGG